MKYYIDENGTYLGGFDDAAAPPEGADTFISTPPADARMTYDGQDWVYTEVLLLEHLADYRWQKETGGILSQGYGIDTTDRSKTLLSGAYSKILDEATPEATMDFKTASGWQTLTHATIEAIALDVAEHVRKCFAAEAAVTPDADGITLTTPAEVETAFDAAYAAA